MDVPISQGIIELYIYTHIYKGTYIYICIIHTLWHSQICAIHLYMYEC